MRTGVYADKGMHTAIVVKIDPTTRKCAYIHMRDGKVDLDVARIGLFQARYPYALDEQGRRVCRVVDGIPEPVEGATPSYPILKAAIGLWTSTLTITDKAKPVMEILVKKWYATHGQPSKP